MSHCLEEVPEETREWNPDIAPQATITKIMGQIGGAPSGEKLIAGATIKGCAKNIPKAIKIKVINS
jgi:hypothetical protein